MKEKNGGPAFPVSFTFAHGDESIFLSGGMTLRDYFAAKASDTDIEAARLSGESPYNLDIRCRCRFRHADAMLAAREATP